MNKFIRYISVMPLAFGLSSVTAHAAWVDLGQIDSGYSFSQVFNLNDSDYVSEQNIASETLTFGLDTTRTVSFFADSFNFANEATVFNQIDLLNHPDFNYITGVGSIDGLGSNEPNFSYTLNPGDYQVNYKGYGHELGWSPDRVVGEAEQGLGEYRLGLSIDGARVPEVAAVPEPETYAMLLAGIAIVGFSASRHKKSIT